MNTTWLTIALLGALALVLSSANVVVCAMPRGGAGARS
jgi:hypothetical protein